MQTEIIPSRNQLLIRRLILAPGEAMPWHTDACNRFSDVVRGAQLRIEFRDTAEQILIDIHAGMAGWDEPDSRVHRAVNTAATPYEEVVIFFLDRAGMNPQPECS